MKSRPCWLIGLLVFLPACSAQSSAPAATRSAVKVDIQALVKQLNDQSRRVRLRAIEQLEEVGPEAKEAIPALLELLHDPDLEIRLEALETLEKVDANAVSEEDKKHFKAGGTRPAPRGTAPKP